jgi:fructose-bisphosphate aldolase class I
VNIEQFEKIRLGKGFIAALDQSGGSTPGALARYGVGEDAYHDDDEMFVRMHEMRARIMADPSFNGDRILGAILFEDTLEREVEGKPTAEYLWGVKHVVPFLKIDRGLEPEANGARCMKPIPGLDKTLDKARAKGVCGTKARSFIRLADSSGIDAVLDQQFEIGRQVAQAGLIPILEPEVDIESPEKGSAEVLLRDGIARRLAELEHDEWVMLKLSIPDQDDFYLPLIEHPNVLRVVALSGGSTRAEATERLARNHGMIASFSRALTEGLHVDQSPEEFTATLDQAIREIFEASLT